jgi:hypothetical protein
MMMSRIRFVPNWLYSILLMFSLMMVQGCINDDLSMCPSPDNLTLTFRVDAGVTGEVDITRTLNTVDILLFDAGGRLVEHKRVERSDLAIYPGAHFTVTPGEYMALAWANASSGSRFSNLIPGESLIEKGYIEMTGAGDTLYYAPAKINAYKGEASLRAEETTADDPYALYRVTVPKGGGEVVKEMPFTRAYRSISIYLKGLENLQGGMERLGQIRAEAHNLSTRYDFLFNTQLSERRDVTRTFAGTLTPGGTLPVARFYSAYGPISGDMSFSVTHLPDEPESVTILLREWLSDNPPSSFDDIDILVEFQRAAGGNVQVNITLPDWSILPVIPEM